MKTADAALPGVDGAAGQWPYTEAPSRARRSLPGRRSWPQISVVTPSYNQARFLEASLRSVLLQNYPALEYIVMDGGSSDGSMSIIEKYQGHLAHWQSHADAGQSDAIASGFERAGGDILCWLNSDDMFLPGTLQHVARAFAANPRIEFLYGDRLLVDTHGAVTGCHVWPRWITAYHWAAGQPLAQECCFWRRELYERVGGMNRERFFIMDHDLFVRMWQVTRLHKTQAFLGCLRIHGQAKGARHRDVWQRELDEGRARYGLRMPGPIRAQAINHLDRWQARFARARLPVPQPGSDPGLYGPEDGG